MFNNVVLASGVQQVSPREVNNLPKFHAKSGEELSIAPYIYSLTSILGKLF